MQRSAFVAKVLRVEKAFLAIHSAGRWVMFGAVTSVRSRLGVSSAGSISWNEAASLRTSIRCGRRRCLLC